MIKIEDEKHIVSFTEGIINTIEDGGKAYFFSPSDTIEDYKEGLDEAENKIEYINCFIAEHLTESYLETEWFINRELKN
jgi:hypothetical protein